jgi:hypothetical protein
MNMNISASKPSLSLLALAAAIVFPLTASAAKLPNGTLLTLNPGVVTDNACISGSCFSMEIVKGFTVWTALKPGTDGGILLGKNQLSGGQEVGANSETNAASGEITGAFPFFANYGTFATAPLTGTVAGVVTSDSSLNYFDDASCAGAACTGVTQLGTWNVAWGGMAAPMGSDGGCLSANCTAAQLSGIFISNWTVNPDKTYSLDYNQVVPDGHPSGFGNQPFTLRLAGTITTPGTVVNLPPVAYNVLVEGAAGAVLTWKPVVSDTDGPSPVTCFIGTPPANGSATIAADCSSGSYISGIGFSGIDTFTYGANDGLVNSNLATVTAATTGTPSTACTLTYPVKQYTYNSKSKLTMVVTGNIKSNNNHEVRICPTTRLEYNATSTVHPVTCYINNVVAAPTGSVAIGAQLKCNVKPYASDQYKIRIKSAI